MEKRKAYVTVCGIKNLNFKTEIEFTEINELVSKIDGAVDEIGASEADVYLETCTDFTDAEILVLESENIIVSDFY